MYTRFQTKTVQRLYPLGRHIPTMAYIWGYPGHFKPDLPRSQGSLSYPSLRENPGNEVGPCILAPSCKKNHAVNKEKIFYIGQILLYFSFQLFLFQKLSKRTSVQKLPCQRCFELIPFILYIIDTFNTSISITFTLNKLEQ